MVDYKKWSTIVDSDDEDEAPPRRTGSQPTAAAGVDRPETLEDLARRMPLPLYRKLTEAQLAATSGTRQEAERCPLLLPRFARTRASMHAHAAALLVGAQCSRRADGGARAAAS